jgi:hypothetical protein
MTTPFGDVGSAAIRAFHDARVADRAWAASDAVAHTDGAWRWIEANHRCNTLLWDEEDKARRRDVPDATIAGNKRAIDGYNQRRNDAIENLDETLLARLAAVTPGPGAWHNSETAGAMADRMSILALKSFHMDVEARRTDAGDAHVAACREKLARLTLQRDDLARCYDTLLAEAAQGRAFWRVYRQFKMYNDPTLNPYLYGGRR